MRKNLPVPPLLTNWLMGNAASMPFAMRFKRLMLAAHSISPRFLLWPPHISIRPTWILDRLLRLPVHLHQNLAQAGISFLARRFPPVPLRLSPN